MLCSKTAFQSVCFDENCMKYRISVKCVCFRNLKSTAKRTQPIQFHSLRQVFLNHLNSIHKLTSLNKSQFSTMNNWINYVGWLVNWFKNGLFRYAFDSMNAVLAWLGWVRTKRRAQNEWFREKVLWILDIHTTTHSQSNVWIVEQLSVNARPFLTLRALLLLLLRYIDNFICVYYFYSLQFYFVWLLYLFGRDHSLAGSLFV